MVSDLDKVLSGVDRTVRIIHTYIYPLLLPGNDRANSDLSLQAIDTIPENPVAVRFCVFSSQELWAAHRLSAQFQLTNGLYGARRK